MAYPDTGISVVVAGLHDLSYFEDVEQIRHIIFTTMFVHEEYDGTAYGAHDIGLLAFFNPFILDGAVNVIALPALNEVHTGVATLHGWGNIDNSFYPEFPNVLQTANMPIIATAACRTSWDVNPTPIHDNHICAGQAGVGACDRDRGGALTQDGEIVGITSLFAFPCGQADRPAVYVRVSAYITWILDTIDNL